MVRTRHSGDIDVVESSEFMSLDNERERFTMQKRERSGDSSQSRQAYQDDDDYNIFEDKVVDSRLRPRTGPRRAYNYLDADSSDDGGKNVQPQNHTHRNQYREHGRLHKRHSSHLEVRQYEMSRRHIKKEMLEERGQSTRQISSRLHNTEADMDEDNYQLRRRSSRQSGHQQSLEDQTYRRRTRRNSERLVDQKDGEEDDDTEIENRKEEDTEDDEQKDQDTDNEHQNSEFSDMYSRVKRKRVRMKQDVYDDDNENRNNNRAEDSDEEGDVSIPRRTLKKKAPEIVKSYSLREHKPRTVLYKAPVEERKIRKNANSIFEVTPTKKTTGQPYQSPAQRRQTRKRSAMNSSSSSTSSSSGESSDEKSFKKRKAKSMAKARSRMMPMNFSNSDPPSGVVKDRVKSGASLADVEPMNIDKNITFDSIGGLGKHIRALKEMVVFPLLYDKVFQKFNVDPPRGVLFYGPPGTGKTLVARALANECSHGEKRVAFFMRKGADCLSKWVGESERQLRLLFDQAYKYRPSIIFFDEIDGLAPVRSSRQDQIHSSIVSTLLALMDGLDSRGEIVVIGATNRIDSLDPALRRPGRFDREFLFPLPTLEARKQILKIQTASWNPRLNDRFITELSEKCVGYCGADLKALCTEAAMLALRRSYPQIYLSNEALQLDESSISVCAKDFFNAVSNIIPTSRRSVNSPGRPLSLHILPLLQSQLNRAVTQLSESFSPCLMKMSSLDAVATSSQAQALADSGMTLDELASDDDEDAPSIYVSPVGKGSRSQARKSLEDPSSSKDLSTYLSFTSFSTHQPSTFRPRMMLTGYQGQGQTSYLAPAIIHKMEDLPVHVLDLPALYAVTAKTPEESCANVFHEAKRKCPSIIYMPYINQWWDVLGDTLRTTLLTLIQDLNPSTPLLLLATSEQSYSSLDPQLQSLFSEMSGEVMKMSNPNAEERKNFFKDLLLQHSCKAPPQKKTAGQLIKILEETKKTNFLSRGGLGEYVRMINFTEYEGHDVFGSSPKRCRERKAPVKISSAPLKKPIAASLRRPNFRSSHKMHLRSRRTIRGCNNNHTADIGRPHDYFYVSQFDKLHCFPQRLMKPNVFGRLINSRLEHHDRLRQRFSLMKQKLVNSNINTNCSNHFHVFNRLWRYHRKLDPICCNRSKFKPSSAQSFIRHIVKRQKSCHHRSRKCLSSGSVQMLYRKNNKKSLIRSDVEPAVPINLLHLKKCTTSGSRFRLKNLALQRKIQIGYNLISQSDRSSNACRIKCQNHQKIDSQAKRMLEVLPKATPVTPRELTKQEMNSIMEKEELTLMELRIFLRDVLNKLGSDKKFSIFTKAVNIENTPDYYEVIENPMDLSTMMSKIDCHEYNKVRSFMDDIDLICSNALEYNPDKVPMDRLIRHRACALKDTAYAIIRTELDKEFEKMCVEIEESRKRRGAKSTTVPNFYRTKPVSQNDQSSRTAIPSYLDCTRPPRSIPKPEGERFSRRVRGLHIDPTPSLEDVERVARTSNVNGSPQKEEKNESAQNSNQTGNAFDGNDDSATQEYNSDNEGNENNCADDSMDSQNIGKSIESKAQTDPLHKKKSRSKCVWCKPTRKRRKLFQSHLLSSIKRKIVHKSRTNIGDEEEKNKNSLSPSVNQPLNIEINASSETDELKSPVRKSSRLTSPQIFIAGVTTRRQSLSPRSREPVETKVKDPPQVKTPIPIQESTSSKHDESSHSVADQSITEESPFAEEKEQIGVPELLEKTMENLKNVEPQPEIRKAAVVKSLDLDFNAVDSGAGSSLDGNGDSRDSTDNKLEEAQPTTSSHQVKDINQNNKHDSTVLSETPSKLVVPTEKLSKLLDRLVLAAEGFTVERLEKIYSQLSQIIFRHKHCYDRSDMVTELEKKVAEMTRQHPSVSSLRH